MDIIRDRIQFIAPRDREYLFAAMSVIQSFVNNYDQKMAMNDVSGGKAQYVLEYDVDVEESAWELLLRQGLKLTYARTKLDSIDMLIDMSDEKVESFQDPHKHVAQIYGSLCGIGTSPLIELRQVKPRLTDCKWAVTGMLYEATQWLARDYKWLSSSDLEKIQSGEWTGIIGWASWQTYMTCCFGMPVIEIIPADRPRQRLSKWSSPLYRVVEAKYGNIEHQIEGAKRSIETLCSQVLAEQLRRQMQTEQPGSTATDAENSSVVRLSKSLEPPVSSAVE